MIRSKSVISVNCVHFDKLHYIDTSFCNLYYIGGEGWGIYFYFSQNKTISKYNHVLLSEMFMCVHILEDDVKYKTALHL